MNNRFDRLLQNGTLKFTKVPRSFGRLLGIVMAAQVALIFLALAGLSSCMASVPSTFPEVQVPSSPSAALPGPPSTSQPSGSGLPQPSSGGGQPEES